LRRCRADAHNFLSAAVGIALAAALVRPLREIRRKRLANFWVDLVRLNYYLLLRLLGVCRIPGLEGMIQNFQPLHKSQTYGNRSQIQVAKP